MAEQQEPGKPLGRIKTPQGFLRKSILIPTRHTGKVRIEALVCGRIAVYRDLSSYFPEDGWTVSHSATGRAVLLHAKFATAVKYARLLDERVDWRGFRYRDGELLGWSDERKKQVLEVILPARPELAEAYHALKATA